MCLCALVPALNDGLLVVVDEVPSPITGGGVGKITMYVLRSVQSYNIRSTGEVDGSMAMR